MEEEVTGVDANGVGVDISVCVDVAVSVDGTLVVGGATTIGANGGNAGKTGIPLIPMGAKVDGSGVNAGDFIGTGKCNVLSGLKTGVCIGNDGVPKMEGLLATGITW